MSCLVGKPLALCGLYGQRGALFIVDAKFGAGVLSKIKLGQVSIKMLGIDMLVNADDAALEDREKTFQRVRMHIATPPLELGMVNRAVARRTGKLENWRAVADQAAALIKMLVQARADAAMVKHDRPDIAAAFDKAQNLDVGLATARTLPGLGRFAHFHIVDFDGLAFAAHRAKVAARCHHEANTVAKVPSGFHAAIEGALKLAGAEALLAGGNELDRLQPQMEREVAILENAADPYRKGLPASVALAQARTAALASQATDGLFVAIAAMGANRAFRPKVPLDIGKSGLFVVEMGG